MVELDFKVTMDDALAANNSIVEVFVNQCLIAHLSEDMRVYSGIVELNEGDNTLLVKRVYSRPRDIENVGIVKKCVSCIAFLSLAGFMTIEPFNCPLECEQAVEMDIQGESPRLIINCELINDEQRPMFRMHTENCNLKSRISVSVSIEELEDCYLERNKMVKCSFLTISFMFLFCLLLALLFANITTVAFLSIIYILLAACCVCSYRMLKKQYRNMRNQWYSCNKT